MWLFLYVQSENICKEWRESKKGINAEKAHLRAKVIPKNAQKDADAKKYAKKAHRS